MVSRYIMKVMFSMRLMRIHSNLFSAVLIVLVLAVSSVLVIKPQSAVAGDPPPPPPPDLRCGISVYTGTTSATVTFWSNSSQTYPKFGNDYYQVSRDGGGWITVAGNSHTFYGLTPGSTHTYSGTATWIIIRSQGATQYRDTRGCGSRTATQDNLNNQASAWVDGISCNAGTLSFRANVVDPDGGTPGYYLSIQNVGDTGWIYAANGSYWYSYGSRPQNGATYSISIWAADAQTGGVVGPGVTSYTCPAPPPPPTPTCNLFSVSPALVGPGDTSTLTWSTSNATSFTVDQGVGSLSPVGGGSRIVGPVNSTRTYTGTASGPGGSVNCSTTLTVGSVGCALNSILAIEPGETYTPAVTISYSGAATNFSATTTVTVNGTTRVHTIPVGPVPANYSTTVSVGQAISFPLVGNYPVTSSTSGTVNGAAYGPLNCSVPPPPSPDPVVPVVLKSYFKVFNGGTTVGAGFNSGTTTCTTSGTGQVSGFASSSPSFHGASTQYDLKALAPVANTFYSSGGRQPASPNFKALTFANNPASGTYGGGYGGTSCITDYYTTTKKTGINTTIPGGVSNINAIDNIANPHDQIESTSGNRTISGGGLNPGDKLVIYITGNVHITSNITLATNYTTVSDIPFFALVVKGNIMIDPTVTQLDGLYIAQPNGGTGGIVYTCANSVTTIPATAAMYTTCNRKLTFNGSVVAKNIKLLRTFGTLLAGTAAETSSATATNTAEVFNGMPELFLANPAFKIDETSTELYDSITSLPPLL